MLRPAMVSLSRVSALVFLVACSATRTPASVPTATRDAAVDAPLPDAVRTLSRSERLQELRARLQAERVVIARVREFALVDEQLTMLATESDESLERAWLVADQGVLDVTEWLPQPEQPGVLVNDRLSARRDGLLAAWRARPWEVAPIAETSWFSVRATGITPVLGALRLAPSGIELVELECHGAALLTAKTSVCGTVLHCANPERVLARVDADGALTTDQACVRALNGVWDALASVAPTAVPQRSFGSGPDVHASTLLRLREPSVRCPLPTQAEQNAARTAIRQRAEQHRRADQPDVRAMAEWRRAWRQQTSFGCRSESGQFLALAQLSLRGSSMPGDSSAQLWTFGSEPRMLYEPSYTEEVDAWFVGDFTGDGADDVLCKRHWMEHEARHDLGWALLSSQLDPMALLNPLFGSADFNEESALEPHLSAAFRGVLSAGRAYEWQRQFFARAQPSGALGEYLQPYARAEQARARARERFVGPQSEPSVCAPAGQARLQTALVEAGVSAANATQALNALLAARDCAGGH